MSRPASLCVHLREFHTQRSFCRHTLGKLARSRAPLSLRFSLSHPLFCAPVESAAAVAALARAGGVTRSAGLGAA